MMGLLGCLGHQSTVIQGPPLPVVPPLPACRQPRNPLTEGGIDVGPPFAFNLILGAVTLLSRSGQIRLPTDQSRACLTCTVLPASLQASSVMPHHSRCRNNGTLETAAPYRGSSLLKSAGPRGCPKKVIGAPLGRDRQQGRAHSAPTTRPPPALHSSSSDCEMHRFGTPALLHERRRALLSAFRRQLHALRLRRPSRGPDACCRCRRRPPGAVTTAVTALTASNF